jgi:hypothetical protein
VGDFMNDESLRERARTVRSIADKADPFTKKRLLDLAESYDAKVGRPSRGTTRLAASQNEIH